jgi:MFS family permease
MSVSEPKGLKQPKKVKEFEVRQDKRTAQPLDANPQLVRIAAENAIVSTSGPPFSPQAIALFFILIIKALNEWQ